MIYATNVKVCPENLTLTVGKWYYDLCATVEPSNATCKSVWWHSSNPLIVAVNFSNGYVFAKSTGTATIYATACDGSGVRSCCTVTVTEPILATGVNVLPTEAKLEIGASKDLCGIVLPTNATEQCLFWTTSNKNVVTVNPDTGLIYAVSPGTATIHATVCDASGAHGSCEITVVPPPDPPTGIEVSPFSTTLKVGETTELEATVFPIDGIVDSRIRWSTSDAQVANVDYSGRISALKPGIATITATTIDGKYSDTCEVWVPGKTPVFLIHGRTSHSKGVWGIKTNIASGKNDHFDSDINAKSLDGKKYTAVDSQKITGFVDNPGGTETPLYLGNKLKTAGYKENVNLFVFNYPNEDAVVHSAEKFKAYIENLLEYVRTSGSDEMKACFYRARSEYLAENHKINIVGHSMGGLVARYYIENIGEDYHVNKLITICTPHWGSKYANTSCGTGEIQELDVHKLCDHDLRTDSKMFGGDFSKDLDCNARFGLKKCHDGDYNITDELKYSDYRFTKYYAIVGIDYEVADLDKNDYSFEMPTNFTTYQQITYYMTQNGVYKKTLDIPELTIEINPKSVGDNMVGFMSQIGWTETSGDSPDKRIQMEKIFIDVDADGNNGDGIIIFEVLNMLHNKIPHRKCVADQVCLYLQS